MAQTPDRPGRAPGRRERKKQEVQRRIFDAAHDLFARHGYAAVTTQQVAEAADVGAGTLFRYANTKAELLIMVMNERLRTGAEHGLDIAERDSSPVESIFGLVEPLIQAALSQPENTAAYQREVLFGADGPYRAEALERIRALEAAITRILSRYAGDATSGTATDPDRTAGLERAAEAVFSVLYLKLIRLGLGRVRPQDLPAVLRSDIEHLVRGLVGGHPAGGGHLPEGGRPAEGGRPVADAASGG